MIFDNMFVGMAIAFIISAWLLPKTIVHAPNSNEVMKLIIKHEDKCYVLIPNKIQLM
jgi:hypothetical protein